MLELAERTYLPESPVGDRRPDLRRTARLNRDAICRSIRAGLDTAGLSADQIGHVNAHAAGTTNGDPVEAQAIRACLGDTPVTAPKSFFGNLGAGGGAVGNGRQRTGPDARPGSRHTELRTPRSRLPGCGHTRQGWRSDRRPAMVLSQSGTGQATSVVLEQPD